jgi:hypothetical protein
MEHDNGRHDDKERARSGSNGDRQERPSCAEDDNAKRRTGGRTPDGRFAKGNRAAAGQGECRCARNGPPPTILRPAA